MAIVTWVTLSGLCVLYFVALSLAWIRAARNYALWLVAFPTFGAVLVLLAAILCGAVGQDYGLQDLFWHEQRAVQFVAGVSVAALVLLLWF